jgi:hypothetical protein
LAYSISFHLIVPSKTCGANSDSTWKVCLQAIFQRFFTKKKLEIIWTSNVTHGQDDKLSIIFFRATRGDKNQKLSQNRKIFSYLNICERIYLKTNGKDSKHIILRWYEILINRINYRLIVRASMREPLLLNIKSALKNQLLLTGCGDSWL